MKPLVSVLMCFKNEDPAWLKTAVDSVLAQTYENFELILVNDGSTQRYEFLDQYVSRHKNIKYLINETNIGLTKSLNKGIGIAQGKYIARLDSHDISFPHRLETQVDFLENHSEYILIASRFLVSEKGKEYEPLESREIEYEEIRKMISSQNFAAHSTLFARTDILRKIGGYNEFYFYAQDYELYLRLLKIGKIKVLNHALVKRHVLEGAISYEKRREQRFYALLIMFQGFLRYGGGFPFLKNFIKALFVILMPSRAVESIKNLPYFKVQR